MFTGIVEETGIVKAISSDRIAVGCASVLEGTKIGDSIAIDGCCQTVAELGKDYFTARVSRETFNVTNFKTLKPGSTVNLERALTPSTRMGGHIVSGHVDCTGVLVKINPAGEFYDIEFEIPQEFAKYIVHKGSVAVNGISLTIAQIISAQKFKVAVIPHTFENTGLKNLTPGSVVNIETDILGKYVEKLLCAGDNKSRITESFLTENGFA